MHIHPNAENGFRHAFACDTCGRIAGIDSDESEALAGAREMVRDAGWEMTHPGWRLTCPTCRDAAANRRDRPGFETDDAGLLAQAAHHEAAPPSRLVPEAELLVALGKLGAMGQALNDAIGDMCDAADGADAGRRQEGIGRDLREAIARARAARDAVNAFTGHGAVAKGGM